VLHGAQVAGHLDVNRLAMPQAGFEAIVNFLRGILRGLDHGLLAGDFLVASQGLPEVREPDRVVQLVKGKRADERG
jgi:hypothetical protein